MSDPSGPAAGTYPHILDPFRVGVPTNPATAPNPLRAAWDWWTVTPEWQRAPNAPPPAPPVAAPAAPTSPVVGVLDYQNLPQPPSRGLPGEGTGEAATQNAALMAGALAPQTFGPARPLGAPVGEGSGPAATQNDMGALALPMPPPPAPGRPSTAPAATTPPGGAPPAAPAAPIAATVPPAPRAPSTGPASEGDATTTTGDALFGAVHHLESSGRNSPGIYGDGGRAAGPMQVHQGALADFNRANNTAFTHAELAANPDRGLEVGRWYLAQQRQRFGSDALAMAAYNAGPGAVSAAVERAQREGGDPISYLSAPARRYVAAGLSRLGQVGGAPPASGGGVPVPGAAPTQGTPPASPGGPSADSFLTSFREPGFETSNANALIAGGAAAIGGTSLSDSLSRAGTAFASVSEAERTRGVNYQTNAADRAQRLASARASLRGTEIDRDQRNRDRVEDRVARREEAARLQGNTDRQFGLQQDQLRLSERRLAAQDAQNNDPRGVQASVAMRAQNGDPITRLTMRNGETRYVDANNQPVTDAELLRGLVLDTQYAPAVGGASLARSLGTARGKASEEAHTNANAAWETAEGTLRDVAIARETAVREGFSGTQVQQRLKRFAADTFGIEILGTTADGLSIGRTAMERLQQAQVRESLRGQGAVTEWERQQAAQAFAGIANTPEAYRLLLDLEEGSARRQLRMRQEWQRMKPADRAAIRNSGSFDEWRQGRITEYARERGIGPQGATPPIVGDGRGNYQHRTTGGIGFSFN